MVKLNVDRLAAGEYSKKIQEMVCALILSARVLSLSVLSNPSPPLCLVPRPIMPQASMPRLDAVASSSAAPSATRERQLLRGVIAEALDAQARKRHAL